MNPARVHGADTTAAADARGTATAEARAAAANNPRGSAAAVLLGAATVAGFAPLGLYPLPFLALAGLLHLWRGAATPRRAGFLGFAFGAGLFLTGTSWIYISLHDFGLMPAPLAVIATVAFCCILGLFPAAVGYLQARASLASPAGRPLFIPALWMLSEWLRGWLFTGFPWLALGYSQTDSPLAGFAPLVGVFGLSWLVVQGGALLLLAIERRVAGLAGLAVLMAAGLGLQQIEWTGAEGEPVSVSLLQGNIPQDMKWDEARYAGTVELYRNLVNNSSARLTILPETAIPRFLDRIDPEFLRALDASVRARGGDLIVGLPLREAPGRYFNSVISVGASAGQRYDKTHLVPLGEFIPPGFGWIIKVLQIPLADFTRGATRQAPLALAGQRIAVNICYEDAFGEEIIGALPAATLLANVSNVAWFGDSLAPHQHLQIAQMRSLETGRTTLRATNTGMTAIIDHRGRIASVLPEFTRGSLNGFAQGRSGATPYVRWGNFPVVLLAFVACGVFMLRRKQPAAGA